MMNRRTSYSTFTSSNRRAEDSTNSSHMTCGQSLWSYAQQYVGWCSEYVWESKNVDEVFECNATVTMTARRLVVAVVSFLIATFVYINGKKSGYVRILPDEWHWDHNVYIPSSKFPVDPDPTGQQQVSVIAQVVPGRALRSLADISSKPNRAYAKQWGLDFARYDSGHISYDARACFLKVTVLNTILDNQNMNESGDSSSMWPHSPRMHYDSILLIPVDSVLTELDSSILDGILPSDKLVAIAGWNEHQKLDSSSDVIFFNLNHQHIEAVAKLWLEMTSPSHVTCGASNDLEMLATAISLVMDQSEQLEDLIEPLQETRDGYVGERVIRFLPSSVPGPRTANLFSSLQVSAARLQAIVDSVCYRFYPKCEVLTAT